jgi:hypothetical protein
MSDKAVAEWLAAVRDAERRGELLVAFDLAGRALEEHPDDIWLKHRAVLALARAGATGQAAARFEEEGLGSGEAEHEDIPAAGAYDAVFTRTGGYYPAINAATLALLGGDCDRATALARRVLELLGAEADSYYVAATEAEAWLLLGDAPAARSALERAAGLHDGDYGAVSTTRRQLRLVCGLRGIDANVLAALRGPGVVHFCGHRIAARGDNGRFRADDEARVTAQIRAEVEREPATYAYGGLASGGDILWAEALLEAGAELHVVLPFERDEFLQTSVASAGAESKAEVRTGQTRSGPRARAGAFAARRGG